MDEKKKMIVLCSIVAAVILLIIGGSIYENCKSKKYLDEFYSAFNGSENKLVMIGRDNCSWCQLFKPSLDSMKENYNLEYLYVNTNELTSSAFSKLLKDIGVDKEEFGTPLTLVVKDGEVVDSISGYVDEQELLTFLKKYNFVSNDAKLVLNYVDYNGYKSVVRSNESKILVLGQTTCSHCIKVKPILSSISKEYGITINYLDITKLSDEERGKFTKYLTYLDENEWGTPLTVIVKNGEVLDSVNGELDHDGYVEVFKKNGFIK